MSKKVTVRTKQGCNYTFRNVQRTWYEKPGTCGQFVIEYLETSTNTINSDRFNEKEIVYVRTEN